MKTRRYGLAIALAALLQPWRQPASGQTFQELHSFRGPPDGSTPQADLIQGSDGNFYGTTFGGGAETNTGSPNYDLGTIFKMTPEGAVTILASFNGTNGMSPIGALLQASDGCFYGTTQSPDDGVLFKLTPDGTLTAPVGLSQGYTGAPALGELVQGPDGKIYGATDYGGQLGSGTIFRVRTNGGAGEIEIVMAFGNGAYPGGGLVLGSDGNFYGTTAQGGTWDYGTVFRLTTNGTLTILASFKQAPGTPYWPYGRLLQTSDGNFYGTADGPGGGSIFKMTPAGAVTLVASGVGTDLQLPADGLVLANDGAFYTMTGNALCGEALKLSPSGAVTSLFFFTQYSQPYPGCNPYGGFIQGKDGNLYGTCGYGSQGKGNIFRLIMPGPLLAASQTHGQLNLSWRTNYAGFTLQNSPDLTNWSTCTNAPTVYGGQFLVTNPISGPAGFFRLKK